MITTAKIADASRRLIASPLTAPSVCLRLLLGLPSLASLAGAFSAILSMPPSVRQTLEARSVRAFECEA